VLEQRLGGRAGVRHYIRVLQLLADHPLERVQQAVSGEPQQAAVQAERIIATVTQRTAAGVASGSPEPVTPMCHDEVTPLCQYQVPRPDLSQFDQLLSQGDSEDGR
jgi:hypothetical protein